MMTFVQVGLLQKDKTEEGQGNEDGGIEMG